MAGIGAGYDLSVSTLSPDGRVFQVEYAAKAADNGSTTLGIVCKDGILFATEKLLLSKMAVPGTTSRIFAVDHHITISIAGFIADARELVRRARLEAKEYKRVFDEPIPGKVLSERLALFVHAYTLAWSERPFGAAILLGVCESTAVNKKLSLYSIDTAGTCYKYYGTALGKGRQTAKTEIEKLNLNELSCEEALIIVAKIMHQVHDETRERAMELEMAWICKNSKWEHQMIPRDIIQTCETEALRQLEAAEEEGDTEMRSA